MDDAAGEGMRRLQSTGEASNNTGRRVGGGECGGKGRRKGKGQRMLRTQSRTPHVPDGLSPELDGPPKPRMRLTFDRSPVRTPKVQRSKKPHAGICAGGGR
jgi:hypothetical protein